MGTPTTEESFLLQILALVECLVKLGEIETKSSEETNTLKKMAYGSVSQQLIGLNPSLSILQGQGAILTTFYLLLVIPQEWKKRNHCDFAEIDMTEVEEIAKKAIRNASSTYKNRKPVLEHFRNALSHARFSWDQNDFVINDVNPKDETQTFTGHFSMESLGKIAHALNLALNDYVKNVIVPRR